jgi:Arc/MetJ-type ribon-helix-helix transcriptional regulator
MAMTITLSPELQKRIAEKVERDDIRSADALVEQALTFYLEFEEGGMDEEESFETKAAIDEALDQGDRGEGRPAEQVFARLRAKHGIPR